MPLHSFRCFECRRRKVKCDERPGGCLRCELYGIRCPGYADRFDVVLRHRQMASDNLMRNFQFDQANKDHDRHSRSMASPKSILPLIQQLPVDFDQAALGAYYTSYCVSSATIVSLDYLRGKGNGCLWAAIKVLGAMQLNHTWHLRDSEQQLSRYYAQAASRLNSAIADVSESREDHTMLTILTLTVVEMKQSRNFTLNYWMAHTDGAAALMALRGAEQASSRIGAAMFLQASSQVVIECVLQERHIPTNLLNIRRQLQSRVTNQNHPLWNWHGMMYRFADFWADTSATIKTRNLGVGDAKSLIESSLSIIMDIELIFEKAAPYWDFKVRASHTIPSLIDKEHIYPSLLSARVWNDRRTATILLYTAITRTLEICPAAEAIFDMDIKAFSEGIGPYIDKKIQETASEILAAIPQMLIGLKKKSQGPSVISPVDGIAKASEDLGAQGLRLCGSSSEYDENVFIQPAQPTRDNTTLPYMDTCQIQWPVYFAVQCEFVEQPIHDCLLQVLETAGKDLQMQQFLILAKRARDKHKGTIQKESAIV